MPSAAELRALGTYLENSGAGLMRGVRKANEYLSPWQYLPGPETLAPGAGVVEGNRDMQAAGQAWGRGEKLRALGLGLQGTANTAMEFVPAMAALPAINLMKREPIKAYHGSPHDFDRFDLSKIGTGEGAQAYGHGLYFAENEGVARSYRDALAGQQNAIARASGKAPDSAHIAAIKSFKEYGYSPEATFEGMKKAYKGITDEQIEAALREVNTGGKGRMYEVAIHADPERFLDWDAPLRGPAEDVVASRLERALDRPGPVNESLFERFEKGQFKGEDAYKVFGDQREASAELNNAGIPGIKYLDQGSRTAGDGSRNYVTFSDSIVEILRKYGVGSIAALPPAVQAAIQLQQEQEAQQ